MEDFFKQFGSINRLRIPRNKKVFSYLCFGFDYQVLGGLQIGKSKHFGFIELESPKVSKIVCSLSTLFVVIQEEEQKLRKVALNISKDVKKFWTKIEKLVLYKHQLELEEKKKKALDRQLDFLLGRHKGIRLC
ncbi:hypothetical protein MKW98_016505 [Papaver atlanticum]|uniref:Uncharacterized protein n=1 Tax=Papaver atlanticum TaxID=357466 RepID=A0AAD4T6X7_9MAGN|nr:hypothetical protein MKW98_016505 [Papaver atlanticum]